MEAAQKLERHLVIGQRLADAKRGLTLVVQECTGTENEPFDRDLQPCDVSALNVSIAAGKDVLANQAMLPDEFKGEHATWKGLVRWRMGG